MTPEQASKIITEAMGGCYHRWAFVSYSEFKDINWICRDCGAKIIWDYEKELPDYTTPEGFFKAWDWATKQGWWGDFLFSQFRGMGVIIIGRDIVPAKLINPTTFALTLAEWLEKRDEKCVKE